MNYKFIDNELGNMIKSRSVSGIQTRNNIFPENSFGVETIGKNLNLRL